MVIVEKSFPRGGTNKESKSADTREHIIFGAQQKKIKKVKKSKDVEDLFGQTKDEHVESVSAELLNYDTIQDGMNIMGVVKHVEPLYMIISLPGRMTARVSALDISDAYTKATQRLVENAEHLENYKPLQSLYKVGQIVYGRVQEVKRQEHRRTDITMSLRPSETHAELVHLNVKSGFVFNGAIEEVQEHGYIIESGIKGLRAFMPLEKSEGGHAIGELVFLKVDKITVDKAASTCICKEIAPNKTKIKSQIEPNLDYLLPTTIVDFNVTKQLKDGLQGSIMNDSFTAYVNEHQLSEPLALPEDYEVNSRIKARILYVMPLTKFVYLTLNLRATAGEDAATDGSHYKRGDIVEHAKVHHLGTGGVVLVLDNKFKGVISYKSIKANYKGNYDQDQLLAKYAKKTQHKVRVLDYDLMNSLYICTDDASVVNEKVFALEDVQPGEFVTGVVKQYKTTLPGYELQVGKVKGVIEQIFLSPSTKQLEETSKIRCRVVAVNLQHKTLILTNRPEYMSKNCKILKSLSDAKESELYTGTIVHCYGNYLLVKFFNQVKGVLYKHHLKELMAQEIDSFYVGQTMQFRIIGKNNEQVMLGLADYNFSLGEICPVTVTHTLESGLEIKVEFDAENESDGMVEAKGLIPLRFLSDFEDLLHAKLRMFPTDTHINAACIVKNTFSLRDVEYFGLHVTKDFGAVQAGDILKAFVKNVADDIVELMVPIRNYGKLVKVHLKMLIVNVHRNPNIELVPEQVVYVKVLSKIPETKTIAVSAKLTDVWDGDLKVTARYMERYLDEIDKIKSQYQMLGRSIADYTTGDKLKANFKGINPDNGDWLYELPKKKLTAVVKATLIGPNAKPPKIGDKQECIVLWIDYSNELLYVSNKPGDIKHIAKVNPEDMDFVGKIGVMAKVLLKLDNVFVCSMKKGQQPLAFCPKRLHYNDFEESASITVKEGDFLRLAFIHDKKPIAILESDWKLWRKLKQNREKIEQERNKKASANETQERKVPNNEREKPAVKLKRALETKTMPVTTPTKKKKETKPEVAVKIPEQALFYEDRTPVVTETVRNLVAATRKDRSVERPKTATPKATLPGVANFWTTDLTQLNDSKNATLSSEEESEDEDSKQPALKKKKLTAVEKFKQQREEEDRLRAIEEKYADPNSLPESVDQFDRLVLSDPCNSKHWISYMVFHLQSTEIDKARAVARRAIKAISFRDGDEQLNIWIALLNLELRYGSKETFDETLKEALTYNDPLKIYLRVLEILTDAKKTQELIELIGVVTKKFKAHQDIWKAVANAYFSIGMTERAQQLLQRALTCLPEREHVNTIVMFANLNHKFGQNEMAQTLLDQVVTSYPKRVDVWTQYVDLLVKEELIDSARTVLERAVIQKIPLKKMRTIFKKYLEFEERFGTDVDIQKVKDLATEFVKQNNTL